MIKRNIKQYLLYFYFLIYQSFLAILNKVESFILYIKFTFTRASGHLPLIVIADCLVILTLGYVFREQVNGENSEDKHLYKVNIINSNNSL